MDVVLEKVPRKKMRNQNHIQKDEDWIQKDTIKTDNKNITPGKENNKQIDTLNAVAKQPVVKDTAKKENHEEPQDSAIQKKTNQKKFFLATGIGEQQQIPVAGQTAVPATFQQR